MPPQDAMTSLGLAALLGMLIGFERQRSQSLIAGLRTFTFVTLFGAIMALTADSTGPFTVGAGLISLAGLIAMGNYIKLHKSTDATPGMTTEVAMLVAYGIGVMVVLLDPMVAAATAGVVAVLLHMRDRLHKATALLGDDDVRAIMRFVIITLIILPLVPKESMGPYGVINPHKLWLMVVLIVGISLAGYLAFKFSSPTKGVLLAGVLGGLASSTATTVSAARQAAAQPEGSRAMAVVVALASSVVFARVCIEIFAAAPNAGSSIVWPVAAMVGVSGVVSIVLFKTLSRDGHPQITPGSNPSRLGPALLFAGLYALVLIAVAWVKTTALGNSGVYLVAVVSGLTDVDAVTLTLADLVEQGELEPATASRAIIAATLSNLAFKTGIIASLGTPRMFRAALPFAGLIFAAGLGVIFLWPS